MEESSSPWHIPMGMPRRRSTEHTPSHLNPRPVFQNNSANDDFSDVFGGPPRTLYLTRNLSRGNNFDIFKDSAESMFASRSSSSVSSKKKGHIYENVDDDFKFGSSSQSRSTNSKSSSSELSPLNTDELPKHYPFDGNVYARKQCKAKNCDADSRMVMKLSSNNFGFSRRVLSPERGMDGFDSFANLQQVVDDYELSSLPSSSVCQEQELDISTNEECLMTDDIAEDEDDIMSSYVIEINDFNFKETDEAVGVDEAIAWAKEKCQGPEESASSQTHMDEDSASRSLGSTSILSTLENKTVDSPEDEEQKSKELLDESIKLWSAYKETNIQLLLSTLHHILWLSSGWTVVSLADIIDSSQVKKAYQKARLCLHPDKLQQRGATPPQKYVAAQAFTILQAAWEVFISSKSV